MIKFDIENEEPVRNAQGLCIEADRGEWTSHSHTNPLDSWCATRRGHCGSMGNCDDHFSCISSSGETGLLVGKITKRSPFIGYAGNKKQTEKKRLHDVMKKGDLFFNTGDLLRFDHQNFVYFQDRVGDTFRYVVTNYVFFDLICCFWFS